jgi:hypothetical protein
VFFIIDLKGLMDVTQKDPFLKFPSGTAVLTTTSTLSKSALCHSELSSSCGVRRSMEWPTERTKQGGVLFFNDLKTMP